jgi:protein-L-isoaspartate(D-aspartate) O-methyltransferase
METIQEKMNNDYLVDYLISDGVLKSENLIDAFRKIDRKDFVLVEEKEIPYEDKALQIGYGQTISQPYVVAFMIELLDLQNADKVLDIGSGSGYTTAIISNAIGRVGYVFGLEKIPALVEFGKENIKKYDIYNAFISKASYSLGVRNKKFNKILVSAAAPELPMDLIHQLEENGKLVLPIKDSIYLIEKRDGKVYEQRFGDFSFVPLIID